MKKMPKLHDIFSGEPLKKEVTCPNPNIPIVVDTREKQSLIAAYLLEQNANIRFEKLDIGDYQVGDLFLERKTTSDFVSSMVSKRLQEQLLNLSQYENRALILEGSLEVPKHTAVHPNALRGMLLSIALDFHVPIIHTKDEPDTAAHLIVLAKRYEKKPVGVSFRQSKIAKSLREQKRFILEGFPGIGPSISEKLIDQFGSLKKICNTSEKDVSTIKGFTKEKIAKFFRLLED